MAIKYYCPKCERRFVDWGAEKLGFKCPTCEGSELLRVGSVLNEEKSAKRPLLKRRPKKMVLPDAEEEVLVPDVEDFHGGGEYETDLIFRDDDIDMGTEVAASEDEDEIMPEAVDSDDILPISVEDEVGITIPDDEYSGIMLMNDPDGDEGEEGELEEEEDELDK